LNGLESCVMRAQTTIVVYQVLLVLIAALAVYHLFSDPQVVKASVYGGLISVMMSLLMSFRTHQGLKKLRRGSHRGSFYIYLGVIERLVIAVALFVVGFMLLKLSPIYVVVGLIAGQLGFLVGGFKVKD